MPNNLRSELSFQPAAKGYSYRASETPNTPPLTPAVPEEMPKPEKVKLDKQDPVNPILLVAIEIAILSFVFIVFLLILNFFNIISLSKTSPQIFGFLPHLKQTVNSVAGTKTATATQATTFTNQNQPSANKPADKTTKAALYDGPFTNCPVEKVQCLTGQPMEKFNPDQSLFQGLEYKNLKPNTNIVAVISGDISTQNTNQNGHNFLQITITNNGMNTLVQYLIPSEDFSLTASGASVMDNNTLGIYKSNLSSESALLLSFQIINPKSNIQISVAKDGSGINNH